MSNIRHGETLKKLRDDYGLSVEELASNLGLSVPNTYKYLKFGQSGPLQEKRFSKAMIAYICLLFDQNPEVFGEDESLFQLSNKDGRAIISGAPNLFFGASPEWRQDHDQFLKAYFEAITQRLVQAQYSYKVYDCFSNNYGASHSSHAEEYFIQHEKYFKKIQEVLANRGSEFSYQRIAALPPYAERLGMKHSVMRVISLMFQETFEHLFFCYKNFPDQFSFYVVEQETSPRKYTYGLIDEGQTVISEYDFYRDGIARPDILFVEQQTGPNAPWIKRLAQVYQKEFDQLANLFRLVTFEDLQKAVYEAQAQEKQKIVELERQKEILDALRVGKSKEVREILLALEEPLTNELNFARYRLKKTIEPKVEFLNRQVT